MSGKALVIQTDDKSTDLTISTSGTLNVLRDNVSGQNWKFSAAKIGALEFRGGAGNDRFVNQVANLSMTGFGKGGDDYLAGNSAVDILRGGVGNDTLVGGGNSDQLFGEAGNDVLLGMSGNDMLDGGEGDDHLNGGLGTDVMWGGNGNDVIISIDNSTGDVVNGGAGRNALWVDLNSNGAVDLVNQPTSLDKVQKVLSFSNGADRTLDRDTITDPLAAAGTTYRSFAGNELFSSAGPQMTDVAQGNIGDCYFLAGLGAIAKDSPMVLRQNIVDFNDGTFGVRLGNSFYRVDADLPMSATNPSTLNYAKLGAQNSLWVAIAEKAFAYYRRGANSYASLDSGACTEANVAFGSTTAGEKQIQSYGNAAAIGNDLFNRVTGGQSVTMFFAGVNPGSTGTAPLIMRHMYTVASVIRENGVVTTIVLRNPWGFDGVVNNSNTNDGLIFVTPAQLLQYAGVVAWGAV